MIIRYQNKFRDFLAFHTYHFTRSPFAIGFLVVILLVTFVATWSNFKKEDNLYINIAILIITAIIILGFSLAFYFIIVVLSFISPKNKTMFTSTTLTLWEDSFLEETAYNRNEYKWPTVQRLARTSGHIFIYLAQHVAMVIPRKAFLDDNDWNSFYEFCQLKVKEVQENTTTNDS
jgi:hypothetical protein